MRIVHYNASGPHYKGLEFQLAAHQYHIVDELTRAGHDVITIDPPAELGRVDTPDVYGQVAVDRVKAFREEGGCDLFFSGAIDSTLAPDAVREISAMGVPTVNLNFDDMSHPYRVRGLMPAYDLVWTTDRTNMPIIEGYGVKRLIHLPFAANPYFFKPAKADTDRAVYFIGTCYGARFRSVCTLAQADVPTKVLGQSPFAFYDKGKAPAPLAAALSSKEKGWQRAIESLKYPTGRACVWAALVRSVQGKMRYVPESQPDKGPITFGPGPSFEALPEVYGAAALSLGSIELASTFVLPKPVMFIRLREFEVPMCGGVHFVNDDEELRSYFEPEREMLFYDGPEEMVDKAKYYLDPARDSLRDAVRIAGRKRAEQDHSWSARFDTVFRELGLKAAA